MCLWFVSDGVGEHQQSGMCCQEVLQHGRVQQHLEGSNAAGLQLLDKVKFGKYAHSLFHQKFEDAAQNCGIGCLFFKVENKYPLCKC